MPLEDYLIPGEQIKLQSNTDITYGGKKYRLILTDKRVLLYNQRGLIVRKDDVVTQKLDELQGVKYKEKGLISKQGIIEIQGKTKMDLEGPAAAVKNLYQQIMQFM
ncbi:MAG: hypothetical protein QW292_09035 [Candidatus Parvarchaeota archaeon]